MPIGLIIFFLLIGLIVIIKGGDIFVTAAVKLARLTGIPKIIIGATIVSFATALPELLISALAVAQGSTDLSFGNNIGSIIFNTAVVLAISLIFSPTKIRYQYKQKGLLMLFSIIFLFFAAIDLIISYQDALILSLFLVIFVYYCFKDSKILEMDEFDDCEKVALLPCVIRFMIGGACIALGAQLLINNSIALAKIFNVSERVIGLTIVGMGSSLPELVTTITSIKKKEYTIGLGNILGANILNITLIPIICTIITKGNLTINLQKLSVFKDAVPNTLLIDIPFAIIIIAIIVLPGMIRRYLSRWQGVVLLILYIVYLSFLLITIPG